MPYNASFCQSIILNLSYWQTFLTKNDDFGAWDWERPRILRAISFGLDLADAWQMTYELIVAYSSHVEKRGLSEQWNGILLQAVDSAEQYKDETAEINLRLILARLLRKQGAFFHASQIYCSVIRLCQRVADAFNEARAYTNLGYLYIERGQWLRAEILCLHALALFEQIENDYGQAHTLNHLGLLHIRLHKWRQAEHYLDQACTAWRAMGDEQGLLLGLINHGLLYNEMECPNHALLYLRDALALAQQFGNDAQIGSIYINMGIAYRLLGMPTTAESYAKQAESLYRRFSNLVGMALAWDNLGLACFDRHQLPTARQHLEKSLDVWRQLQNRHDEIRTQLYLVECALAEKNIAEAKERMLPLEEQNERQNWLQRYPDLADIVSRCRHSLMGKTVSTSSCDQ